VSYDGLQLHELYNLTLATYKCAVHLPYIFWGRPVWPT